MFYRNLIVLFLFQYQVFGSDKFDKIESLENKVNEISKKIDMTNLKKNSSNQDFSKILKPKYENLKINIQKQTDRIFGEKNKEELVKEIKITQDMNLNEFIQENRIYIFMSQSVPLDIWRKYGSYIYNNKLFNASMVLRGCIGGSCKYIKPTTDFIVKVLQPKTNNEINPSIIIDPLLFRRYDISKVPCVVYAEDIKVNNYEISEGSEKNLKSKKTYKSCGDWNLMYHLKEIYNQSKSFKVKQLIDTIESKRSNNILGIINQNKKGSK